MEVETMSCVCRDTALKYTNTLQMILTSESKVNSDNGDDELFLWYGWPTKGD